MDKDLQKQAHQLAELTRRKRQLEAEVKSINAELEPLSLELASAFAEQEVRNIRLDDGALVYLDTRLRPTVTDDLVTAFKSNPLTQPMVKETVNWMTLRGWCNELRDQNGGVFEVPDWLTGILKVDQEPRCNVRFS